MDTKLAAKMIPTIATQVAAANTYRAACDAETFARRVALIASPQQAAEIDALLETMWARNR
ncbi:hypothetical protein [Nocardia thailandica]|uniref:hypothetical protein n=1 Tax=Nocardia thailandica TaxID=257275 RepID=UPI0002E29190|nr:hypothetical protein [Nocardia thailandica]